LLTLDITKTYHSLVLINLQFIQVENTPSKRLRDLLEKIMEYECPYLAGNLSSLSEAIWIVTVCKDSNAAFQLINESENSSAKFEMVN